MNPKLLFILVIGIVIVSGFIFTRQSPANETALSPDRTSEQTITETSQSPAEQVSTRYVPYTKEAFDAAAGKKRVYYFHAPWCPTCRPTDAEFQAKSAEIPADVVVFKTDYDSSTDLKKKYAITYQHTFVLVDDNGDEVKKWNGGALKELITQTQ